MIWDGRDDLEMDDDARFLERTLVHYSRPLIDDFFSAYMVPSDSGLLGGESRLHCGLEFQECNTFSFPIGRHPSLWPSGP